MIPTDARYERMFDKMEILISLCCGLRTKEEDPEFPPWFLPGRFVYRKEAFNTTVKEIQDSLISRGDSSPFVPFVGDGAADGLGFLKSFIDFIRGNFRL